MRILAVLLLAFSLSGCATYKALTTSIDNPITEQTLYNVESGGVIIFAGLNAYRRSCIQGLVPASCRAVLVRFQKQTRKLPPLLSSLRTFVKENDQVNARIAHAAIIEVFSEIKATAASNNVKVQ